MNYKNLKYFLPLAVFLVLVFLLWYGLKLDPRKIPSTFINKPLPTFKATDLWDKGKVLTEKDLNGQVTLINVWATWCGTCQEEHSVLLAIARQHKVRMLGLDYKDDSQAAKTWLAQYGNPYQAVGVDSDGRIAIDWGVYGTPETFIVDKQGIVRYKHAGPLTHELWQKTLLPLVEKLQNA